jgi:hypothetical protein
LPARSTIDITDDLAPARRARTLRRIGLGALIGLLAVGASGWLGIRTERASARGGGYELTVKYPRVARPGLAVTWGVAVRKDGGFAGPITLAVAPEFLAIFDENGIDPDPAAATQSPDQLVWEFDPPDGELFSMEFDARIEPAVQSGQDGWVAVLDENGNVVVRVEFHTVVLP